MLLFGIAFLIALFFAVNIGASGSAAAMGAAYGGGALKSRRTAVCLVAVFAFLGANFGGSEVVTTISKGIIPSSVITIEITSIILLSACLTLFLANRVGIPLSTSEVTVGSIVGVGMAYHKVYWGTLLFIVSAWIVLPILAFTIAYFIGKLVHPLEQKGMNKLPRLFPRMLSFLLIIAGCYEAFSAGMNNVANAIGPLVGADMIGTVNGILIGSLFLSLGAIVFGGKVLETNGKKITTLSLLQGSIVSFTSGSLVIIASVFGMPVPLTQATTMAIIGVGSEKVGFSIFKKPIVKQIFKIWVLSPVLSLFCSYLLVEILIRKSLFFVTIVTVLVISGLFFGYYKKRYPSWLKLSYKSNYNEKIELD